MSNINNQIQDFYSIEAVQDLSHETAAAISGGAALELYDDSNFRKRLVETNDGTANVGNDVNDRITSIVVNAGVWRFYTDSQFRGVSADLRPGRYANIGLGIIPNDSISSFQRIG
jgi:hypothetical protein